MSVVLNFLSLRGYFGSFDDAVFGGILILIMLFAPDGIIGADLRRLVRKILTELERYQNRSQEITEARED